MEFWRIALMFVVRAVLAFGFLWLVHRYLGPIPAIIGIPIVGVLLAKPVLEGGATWFNWARKQPYAKWQGNYYEFSNVHIRIFEVGNELWVVDEDLLRVIGEKPSLMLGSLYDPHEYDTIPDTRHHGFSPEGAEKVLQNSKHSEAGRMRLWLTREVYKQHARKRELAKDARR
jgi:hypothetical protein